MMGCILSRRGSVPVFLAVILATLISLSLMLVHASRQEAIISVTDGVMHLAADSVMSEYNRQIQEDYGLFLLQGDDRELTRKFRNYVDFSTGYMDGVSVESCSVSAGRFSVADLTGVEKQIIELMKSGNGVRSYIRNSRSSNPASTGSASDGLTSDGSASDSASGSRSSRVLRHGPTIVSLPSGQLPDKSLAASAAQIGEGLSDSGTIFKGGTEKFLFDSYVLGYFNSMGHTAGEDHFFSQEVEYILSGELSDEKNEKKVRTGLKALRFPLNLAHIYSDPDKVAAIAGAAEILTPGILGTVTQAGIAAVWATAEAANDVKLLYAGYRVPILKDKSSWAIDLDALINGLGDGYVKPAVNRGRDYEDYLRIFLFFKDKNIKTARILDLIQINMRKNHDKDFLVQECATGIAVEAAVCGRSLNYEKTYYKR